MGDLVWTQDLDDNIGNNTDPNTNQADVAGQIKLLAQVNNAMNGLGYQAVSRYLMESLVNDNPHVWSGGDPRWDLANQKKRYNNLFNSSQAVCENGKGKTTGVRAIPFKKATNFYTYNGAA